VTELTVRAEQYADWTLLRPAGEIDLVSGRVLRERVHGAVAEGSRRVLLDLSEVRFCDSSGVGVLIAARRLLRSCGGELRLVLPEASAVAECAPVHRVFAALGVRRLFDIHPDVPSAVSGDEGEFALPA
jgi:anti-anti-sigma factor